MRILSWNLNGLKPCIHRNDFSQIFRFEPIDVICLQETRTKERVVVNPRYHHYWYPAATKKGYSGTLTMTLIKPVEVRYGFGTPELDDEGRLITVDLGVCYVVNTYVPNSQGDDERMEYRRRWDEQYHRFIKDLAEVKPVIACGDYNVTLSRIDAYENNSRFDSAEIGYASEERAGLLSILDDGFVDAYRLLYPKQTGSYTWWSYRRNKRCDDRGMRLDYFLVSQSACSAITNVRHEKEVHGSDHCPIILDSVIGGEDYEEEVRRIREEQRKHSIEDRKLAYRWQTMSRNYRAYKNELEEVQRDLTYYTYIHQTEKVRWTVTKILDSQKFRFLAVHHVVSVNAPPGVDGIKWRTDAEKMKAVDALEWRTFKAHPQKMIEVKTNITGKFRTLGLLTWADKAMCILCRFCLSPIEEAHADRRSFAFRPGRATSDAVTEVSQFFVGVGCPDMYVYMDVKGFYSHIQHKWIVNNVPLPRRILEELLSAGHIFEGELFPGYDYGISESSPLSPIIANYTLDGLEKEVFYALNHGDIRMDFTYGPLVRYADDIIVPVYTEKEGQDVIDAARRFLEKRGLTFSEKKTRIGHIKDGLDFLGYHIEKQKDAIYIRPREESVMNYINRLHEMILSHCGSQRSLILAVNKSLIGWVTQYRFCDAEDVFRQVDTAVYTALLEAAVSRHPDMPQEKLLNRYFFKDSCGIRRYSIPNDRTCSVIHLREVIKIMPRRAPTDVNPYLHRDYYLKRKEEEDIDRINARYRPIYDRQEGRCIYCHRPLLVDQKKLIVPVDPTKDESIKNSAYVHAICNQNDYQLLKTTDDPDFMSEFDVYDCLRRLRDDEETVRNLRVPENWKWIKLYDYFGRTSRVNITLKFHQISEIAGEQLAKTYWTNRAYWNRRASSDHMCITDAWTMQGYRTKKIDIHRKELSVTAIHPYNQRIEIPPELDGKKVSRQVKKEVEHFLKEIVKKYNLSEEEIRPVKAPAGVE